MLKLRIEIEGKSESDLEMALEEVLRKISGGFTNGMDRNESGKYTFYVEGEEE